MNRNILVGVWFPKGTILKWTNGICFQVDYKKDFTSSFTLLSIENYVNTCF